MQPIKVITSGFENLCAFYALFNSIGGKPREIRQEVYANMGLNSKVADEYFAESILPLLEDFDKTMDFKKKLQSDDTLAWSEILKYQKEMFVPKDLVDSERIQMENHVQTNLELRWRNTESKKGLIDEYANFLFYGNGSAVDVRKFPNAITKSSPYNLEEFSELMRIYQHSDVQNLLDVIDDSICYLRIEDEMDPGKYMMVPSVALKFLANFCHNKLWIGKWQNESRVTNGDMERAVYEDSGDYVNPFGADNNLHLQDLIFLVKKLGLESNLGSMGVRANILGSKAVNFVNQSEGHWTGVVDFKSFGNIGDEVYKPVGAIDMGLPAPAMTGSSGGVGILTDTMTALSIGGIISNPLELPIEKQYTKADIEKKYREACMDLLQDEDISRIFQALPKENDAMIIGGVEFFRNESNNNCIRLNGNIFTLNMPKMNPIATDGNVENAKSDLIRNIEYLKNLFKQPSQSTSNASAWGGGPGQSANGACWG